jgi:hypothetical protein
MFKVRLQAGQKNIGLAFARVQNELDKIPGKAYRFFKEEAPTPIKSGNARRNTILKDNEIQANYPYAKRLDEGYSKQAPDGMSKPTIEEIRHMVDRVMRGGRA